MRTLDLSPLFRATVGFDRMMNTLDSASRVDESALGYPPYNIEKTGEDAYRISMAVAGFGDSDLDVTVTEQTLVISGRKEAEAKESATYLHRGIATRAFERRFDLAEHIKVVSASLENGLLSIELAREVPEAMKPRTIAIKGPSVHKSKVIENKAA